MIRNKLNHITRFFRSVFAKLILINLAAWLFILLTVVFTFLYSKHDTKGPFQKNVRLYIHYIVNDLGSPPEKQKALAIFEKTGIHISFSDENVRWTTRDRFPEIDEIRFRPQHGSDTVQLGRRFGNRLLLLRVDDGTLYFDFAGVEGARHTSAHLLLLLFLSAILLCCYLAVKRILLPLKRLGTGVSEVACGNLSHQVPIRGNDELAELAHSFNDMTARLKKMMETKEHLLRDISHELRSPLTRMRVALELIENKEIKGEIELDICEMEEMITAILKSAREHHDSRKQNLQKCNLDQLLKRVTERYTNMSPGVHYTSPGVPLHCKGDESSLRTVFSNLIDNAIKFSTDENRTVEVKLSENIDDTSLITITDFGSGIDEAELPCIFEPFYRVDKSRSRKTGGFGLGLNLCKAIIEAHDGKIEVKSKPGEGTQVLLTFPLTM